MKDLKLKQVGGTGDTLELLFSGDLAWIEIDEPYAGDTEYGYGRSSSFTISKDQARTLALALIEWADK